MTTYTETQGKAPFDWNAALKSRKKDWLDLYKRSASWVTCACGNQCDVIPRGWMGIPDDDALEVLGFDFHTAITKQDTRLAQRILHKIEIRSAQLIAEMQKP